MTKSTVWTNGEKWPTGHGIRTEHIPLPVGGKAENPPVRRGADPDTNAIYFIHKMDPDLARGEIVHQESQSLS